MLRSLTVKWIVTLLLTSLTGVILVGIFTYQTTASEYDRLRTEQAQAALVDMLSNYYRQYQTWDGLENWLQETYIPPQLPSSLPLPPQFALADARNVIVIGHGPLEPGQRIDPATIPQGVPVYLDDTFIGTLLPVLRTQALDPREQRYIEGATRALFIGALGSSLAALLIGILLSRHFLHPLSELTRAITAMQQGDLSQQVEVRTQDELGELARTFNEMSAQIHRANQLRKQMTADIAHDLRTPLTVIAGYLEALRDGTLQPTQERFDIMNHEATLLRRLIDDLRILSLADAGELHLAPQPAAPYELLQQVQQSFEPIATEQDIALQVIGQEPEGMIYADPERIIQVLENVVSNALRHTPSGGAITLQANTQQDEIAIHISDTGAGIASDNLDKIFERFYRVEASRTENQGDSGLGLAIAKSIIELHHGTISASSPPGGGTTITITLPAIRQA